MVCATTGYNQESNLKAKISAKQNGHLTADKREIKNFPKSSSATSLICRTLSEMLTAEKKFKNHSEKFVKVMAIVV